MSRVSFPLSPTVLPQCSITLVSLSSSRVSAFESNIIPLTSTPLHPIIHKVSLSLQCHREIFDYYQGSYRTCDSVDFFSHGCESYHRSSLVNLKRASFLPVSYCSK